MNNVQSNSDNKHIHTDESLEAALDESVEAAAALSIRANDLVDRLMHRLHVKELTEIADRSHTPITNRMFNPDAGP